MPSWYLGRIRYQQPIDDTNVGTRNEEMFKQKTVTESYLIDAVSYTDAEARLYRVVADNTPEFTVTALRPMTVHDVFHLDGGDNWYKAKAVYTTEDEKSGKEKKVTNVMLVNAATLRDAHDRLEQGLRQMLVPYEITELTLTPILEVVPVDPDEIPANLKPVAAEAE